MTTARTALSMMTRDAHSSRCLGRAAVLMAVGGPGACSDLGRRPPDAAPADADDGIASDATLTLGPNPVNIVPGGAGVTVINAVTAAAPPRDCSGAFVPFD